MKRSTTLRTLLTLLAVVPGILMAGCGGREPAPPPADTPAPPAATAIPPTPIPGEGD